VSNSLAIATVTATLQRVLQQALNSAGVGTVAGAEVKAARPGTQGTLGLTKGVTIYLYQVMPNAAGRNADLPTRRADGQLMQRPRVALDLHYLLSFFGSEGEFEPQRMAGIIAARMHAQPVLTKQAIRETLQDVTFEPLLNGSDLAEQLEQVIFTPVSFSLEELSKVWSVLFQTAHALSVAYQASIVFIETDDQPKTVLPVRDRGIFSGTVRSPVLTALRPQILTRADKLTLLGRALRGDVTRVRFSGFEPVVPASVADDRIEVDLPADLRPGVGTVSVVHEQTMASAEGVTRTVRIESNAAAFMLAPRLMVSGPIVAAAGAPLQLSVDQKIGPTGRVALLVGDQRVPGEAPAAPTEILSFTLPADLAPGIYPLRVEVDGALSLLTDVSAPPGFSPSIEVTAPWMPTTGWSRTSDT
jgi:hypothetical protein